MVSIRWSRRQGHRTQPLRTQRARQQSHGSSGHHGSRGCQSGRVAARIERRCVAQISVAEIPARIEICRPNFPVIRELGKSMSLNPNEISAEEVHALSEKFETESLEEILRWCWNRFGVRAGIGT